MSISSQDRQTIKDRAGNCCEYCRVSEIGRLSKFQIDHIIPVKHGGIDKIDNLCLACLKCNSYKGSNVAALDPETGDATKLFNPRLQNWDEHFEIASTAHLIGKTPEGRATILVLRINEESRVKQRLMALHVGDYPCVLAEN